ncbi:MAG TPA: helix-turn-helix transcriptional regulator [Puia sp.]|jgi:AraC-like DNA-binding protein
MFRIGYGPEAILCFVSASLTFLAGGILLSFSARGKPNRFLGLSYLSFAMSLTVIGLIYSRLISYVPHVYRTGNIFALLYMPLSYLYVRSLIVRMRLSGLHFLHLLPIVVYLIDYLPFFFSSASYKEVIISGDLDNLQKMLRYQHGWLLPSNVHIQFRTLQMFVYWILQVILLSSSQAASMREKTHWMRWQYIYHGLQLFVCLPPFIVLISGSTNYVWVTSIPYAAAGVLSAYTLFFTPDVLYNIKGDQNIPSPKPRPAPDTAFILQLGLQLDKIMKDRMPYLDPNYTIRELAETIDIPLYKLSAYLNLATGKHFSDYLNQWRIQYCLELIREKKLDNLNLHGIATKCGFNNRNTFSAAFKKVTGKPPSVYLQASC